MNPIPDVPAVLAFPDMKATGAQHLCLLSVQNAIVKVLPQIELGPVRSHASDPALQILWLAVRPGHPGLEMLNAGLKGLL